MRFLIQVDYLTQLWLIPTSWDTTFQRYRFQANFFSKIEVIWSYLKLLILQGTIAFTSLYGAHKDQQVWSQPELFQPQRFLDETGKFSPKLDKTLAFGAGKRVCAGETFSRNALFLAVSALVQNFDIVSPENEKVPLPSETRTGTFRYTPEYRLKFLPRSSS